MGKVLLTLLLLICTSLPALAAPTNTSGPWGVDASGFRNLSTALASPGTVGKTVVVSQPMTINNKTITGGRFLKVVPGGSINIATGKTLATNGQFEGADGCFPGPGAVTGLKKSYPEYWQVNTSPSTTNMATAVNAARAALNNPGVLVLGPTYYLGSEILIPYKGITGGGVSVEFNNTQLVAMNDNMTLMRWSDSGGHASGNVKFVANGHTGVYGFKLAAENETQTDTVVNQNDNKFLTHMEFVGTEDSFVGKVGAKTGSGCWYNYIESISCTSVKRCQWFADSGSLDINHSGANSNFILNTVVRGSSNTGVQVDAGGGNTWAVLGLEQINLGTSPSAVPTGYKVADTMANGGKNNDNKVLDAHWENVTKPADINNATTMIHATDGELLNSLGTIIPFTEQYRRSAAAKGTLVNEIYKTVTSPANIRALWLFDEYGSATTTINDRSTKGHAVTLRDASLATLAASNWGPTITGEAPVMVYNDESHLWDTPTNADFNFGNGATDTGFSIVTLVNPTLEIDSKIIAKDSRVTGATQREWSFELTAAGALSMFLFDDSADATIGRTTPNGTIAAGTFGVLAATYDGTRTSAGVKVYYNSAQVDNANLTAGTYTAMEAKSAKVGNYSLDTAGSVLAPYHGQLSLTLVVAETLTATQVRQLSYLLNSFAGGTLK